MANKEIKQADSKGGAGLWIGLAVVALVLATGAFMMTKNGVAEPEDKAQTIAASESGEEQTIKTGNPVVAIVNGEDIKRSDVFAFISNLPEQMRQMPIQTLFPMALDQVVNNKLVSDKAAAAGLENDAEVQQIFEETKSQIVRNVYIERQIEGQLTEAKLQEAYDQLTAQIGDVQETKASHILLETEEQARDVIAKIGEGADFAELAKELSADPAGANGGDLGYFAKNEMVPEFAEAAFALGVDEYSKDPVQTQFGWHVIKVYDRRDREKPALEEIKPQLQAQLRQKILTELVETWQGEADIKKFDINGEAAE